MNEPGFYQFQPHHHHHLDPSAQEFFPSLPLIPHQIYYPYHPSYPTPFCPPAYVSTGPSPPVPLSLPPPCSTPSRALVLSLVPADVSESMLRNELEVYGDVRAVQMEKLRRDGIVTVHFYDLRHAQTALVEIQEQHMQHQFRLKMHYDAVFLNNNNSLANLLPPPLPPPARGLIRGRAVWAQFTFPVTHGLPDGYNQGTLVIFNLNPLVSASSLQQIFEAFGPVKELRHTPTKKNQRFVEFYDTRDAAKALAEMTGKELNGKRIMIEFSRPGGHGRRFSPPPQPPPLHHKTLAKRSSFVKSPGGNGGDDKCNSNGGGSIQHSIASLCISAKGSCEESCKIKHSKKITKKCNNYSNGGCGGGALKHHQAKSSRLWKGSRQVKEYDPLFVINEDAIMESDCKDSRTTVMIKNIPNKYSLKLLLNLLDNHCISTKKQIGSGDDQPLSSYDFVYLPIDFINKCNVGYAFVNMTSPEATWRLYKAFHLQSWEVFNSRKICEVTYARLQGVEAMREHFKNSKFPCDEEDYMPVVFSPPRNGRQLTEPLPIVGGPSNHPSPHLLSSSSAVGSNQDQSEASSDNNNNAPAADGDDNMDGQDLSEQIVEQLEVNEAAEHIDDGVGGGRNSGGDSGDHYDNDDVDDERQP